MDEVAYQIDWILRFVDAHDYQMQSDMVSVGMTMLSAAVEDGATVPGSEALRLRVALEACAAIVHAPGYHSSENYWMQFLRIGREHYPDRSKHWWWWIILPNAK